MLLGTDTALGWNGFPQMIITVLSGFQEFGVEYGTRTAGASFYSLRNKA
jgi:hypothetical protein